ncbi:MAG: hypothetical protein KF901_02460 [Myxococcales bacterium]|nr:hypothetical protein [Myxococcales bacterium]
MPPASSQTTAEVTSASAGTFVTLIREERLFLMLMALGFMAVGIVVEDASIARWLGFALAGYSAVANDSIQTIGTFIASNRNKPWWMLWLFMGGIFVATTLYSWFSYGGDVSHQRLASKGFDQTPMNFTYLQVAAPLVLMMLTRMRMPVSTTFMLLTCFAAQPGDVWGVVSKSLIGYVAAFATAIAVWYAVSNVVHRYEQRGPAHASWRIFQWFTSGTLWAVWLMQDAANIAVFLPRSLSVLELLGYLGVVVVGLAFLFRVGGERVQKVVDEKSRVTDVRSATVIDLVYAIILYFFKEVSNLPMSTTWVFVGLLAGRELAMSLRGVSGHRFRFAARMMGKDLLFVTIGLIVSVLMAAAGNPQFLASLLGG